MVYRDLMHRDAVRPVTGLDVRLRYFYSTCVLDDAVSHAFASRRLGQDQGGRH